MKTTIQHVASDLYDIDLSVDDHAKVMLLLKKHFDTTEKQQIIHAYEKGVKDFANYDPERHGNDTVTGIQHYTSTYTTNKETLK